MHAKFAPSSAHLWGPDACPAHIMLASGYPDFELPEAKEGEAAHWVASEILIGNPAPQVGSYAPNGEFVTEDMIDGANIYLDAVRAENIDPKHLAIEDTLFANDFDPEFFGTPDAYFYNESNSTLYVFDYKFGHRFVDEVNNPQLLCYLILIAYNDKLLWRNIASTQIQLIVVQPRAYGNAPVRKFKTHGKYFDEYRDYFRRAISDSRDPSPVCKTGKYCLDCPATINCKEFLNSGMNAIDSISRLSGRGHLNNETLGKFYSITKTALKRLETLEAVLEQEIFVRKKQGEVIPRWTIETTNPPRQWTATLDEIKMLGEMFDVDLLQPPKTITPAQAMKTAVDADLIQSMSFRPGGKAKLVEIDPSKILKTFGDPNNV